MTPQPHPIPLSDVQKKTLRHLDTLTEMISGRVNEQMEKNKISDSLLLGSSSSNTIGSSGGGGTAGREYKRLLREEERKRQQQQQQGGGGSIDVVSCSNNLFDLILHVYIMCVEYGMYGVGRSHTYIMVYIRKEIKCYKYDLCLVYIIIL